MAPRVHLILRVQGYTDDAHVRAFLVTSSQTRKKTLRCCPVVFHCCVALFFFVLLPLAINLLRPPPVANFAPPPQIERVAIVANWVACDFIAPACSSRLSPMELDVAAVATEGTEALAVASNTTSYAEFWRQTHRAVFHLLATSKNSLE